MKRQNFRIHNRKQLHKVSLKSQKYSSILVALKIPKKFNKMAAKFEKNSKYNNQTSSRSFFQHIDLTLKISPIYWENSLPPYSIPLRSRRGRYIKKQKGIRNIIHI